MSFFEFTGEENVPYAAPGFGLGNDNRDFFQKLRDRSQTDQNLAGIRHDQHARMRKVMAGEQAAANPLSSAFVQGLAPNHGELDWEAAQREIYG